MRIVFNLHRVGLGNNGGSRTIVKSAEALASLGQEVIIASNIRNKYTWEPINKKVNFICSKNIPKGDIIIATGIGSVGSTVSSNFKKKFYFIRGFETWAAKKSVLLKSYKSLQCIVNSGWLKKMLKSNGIKSNLVYNGLDFEDFYDMDTERHSSLGGLYSKRHKTKNHDFISKYSNEKNIPIVLLNRDIKDSNPKNINKWYNTIKVWASPSELEGLHNPPMEASLSGCGLVSTDHPRSGTSDYAISNETALIYKHGDMRSFDNQVTKLLEDEPLRQNLNRNMIRLLKDKIGTRQKNMQKFIEILDKK
jgi:hypothetical protein